MAEGLEDNESFQVKFNGDGPLRGVLATANGKLESRGYVGNPNVTLVRVPPRTHHARTTDLLLTGHTQVLCTY